MSNNLVSYYNLARNKFSDQGVLILSEAIIRQNHIIYLNLSNNSISHKGCKILFEKL